MIKGGVRLEGEVSVSGAKNACLPMFAAALLTDEKCVLKNVPDLSDVRFMAEIVGELGAEVSNPSKGVWEICAKEVSHIAPYELVRKMRASICLLGPLCARMRRAEVSLPGGCVIGARPVDLHIKGLKALNCAVEIERGYIVVDARKMRGANIYLGGRFGSTVTGTANVVMAAVLAPGTTVIENAACEPEIADLCRMLVKMGALIEGAGTPAITITGVPKLGGTEHSVLPDRIEAGTFLIAAAMCGGNIELEGINAENLSSLLHKLRENGCKLRIKNDKIYFRSDKRPVSVKSIETQPYPGFPTDLQAQMTALCCVSSGNSIVTENLFETRFKYVPELRRMGADITVVDRCAFVRGVEKLRGAVTVANDLRGGAALVIAALAAEGESEVLGISHIDRGYSRFEYKLASLGAAIERAGT